MFPRNFTFRTQDGRVAVIDQDNRLRLRHVAVLKKEREQVILTEGLTPGERVMVSGILHPVEGMTVVAKEKP